MQLAERDSFGGVVSSGTVDLQQDWSGFQWATNHKPQTSFSGTNKLGCAAVHSVNSMSIVCAVILTHFITAV